MFYKVSLACFINFCFFNDLTRQVQWDAQIMIKTHRVWLRKLTTYIVGYSFRKNGVLQISRKVRCFTFPKPTAYAVAASLEDTYISCFLTSMIVEFHGIPRISCSVQLDLHSPWSFSVFSLMSGFSLNEVNEWFCEPSTLWSRATPLGTW